MIRRSINNDLQADLNCCPLLFKVPVIKVNVVLATSVTAMGTRIQYAITVIITQCYLPPGTGDIPTFALDN